MEKIRLVCATRGSNESFFTSTALGRSYQVYKHLSFVELRLFADNTAGLSEVYNMAIEEAKSSPAIMMFVHDDVHLIDLFWPINVFQSLSIFGIVGVAGNRRRVAGQPSWFFVDSKRTQDASENLSGVIGHGTGFPCQLSVYGSPGQEVKLLDGVLLVTRSDTLHRNCLRFDPRFDFHFYDLDFCRQAEVKGIRMGTWSISVIHESGGAFRSPGWLANYERYLAKWGA
jgi:GT2 family glycosyltransferase